MPHHQGLCPSWCGLGHNQLYSPCTLNEPVLVSLNMQLELCLPEKASKEFVGDLRELYWQDGHLLAK